MTILQHPPHLCRVCDHLIGTDPDCCACIVWAKIEAVWAERNRQAAMRELEVTARNAMPHAFYVGPVRS